MRTIGLRLRAGIVYGRTTKLRRECRGEANSILTMRVMAWSRRSFMLSCCHSRIRCDPLGDGNAKTTLLAKTSKGTEYRIKCSTSEHELSLIKRDFGKLVCFVIAGSSLIPIINVHIYAMDLSPHCHHLPSKLLSSAIQSNPTPLFTALL